MRNTSIKLARAINVTAAIVCVVCLLAVSAYALTPSGAQIKTSSIANYKNSSGTSMPVTTSNAVTVTVAQVGGDQVTPTTGSATAPAGTAAYVPVTVQNTGNGSDTLTLAVAGDSTWSPKMIADTNGDGVHQSTETAVVTSTSAIAAGATYKCFAVATVPTGATTPCSLTLTATSTADSTKKSQGTFTVNVGPAATQTAYIREWLLNGYYSNTTQSTRLTTDYLGGEAAAAPLAGQVQGGKTWSLRKNTVDTMDFLGIYGSTVQYCAVYSATYVYSPAAVSAQLWLGSNDGVKVWLNGTNVWTNDVLRGCTPDQDKVPIQLKAGWNRLLVKVAQNTSNWALIAKVCDSAGKGLTGVTVSTTPTSTTTSMASTPTLTISGVTATNITANSATINWTTSVASTGTVRYGTTSAYGSSAADATSQTQHSVNLTSLTAGSFYYYIVDAKDASGKTVSSTQATFTTTSSQAATAGYIRSWLLNGMYSNTTQSTRLSTDYLAGEDYASPRAGQISGTKTWTYKQSSNDKLDFLSIYGSTSQSCVAYACTYVYSPSEQDAQLWLGSDDGVKVWANGVNVWTNDVIRGCVADQDKVDIHLLAGWNRMMFKVAQNTSSWALIAKICDASGKALPGLNVAADTGDTVPPTISNVQVVEATGSRMIVTWDTNEPSTTRIDYGTTSPTTQLADPELTKTHAITVTGLTKNTNYVYRIMAVDVCGNWAQSSNASQMTNTDQPAGFISQWLTNGFYQYTDRTTRMATDFLGGEATTWPKTGMVSNGRQWLSANAGTNGYLDMAAVYNNPVEGVGYANVYVYSPARQSASLRIGSDDGVKVYYNGQAIWTNDVYRAWVADQDKMNVTLEEGWNCLLLKLTQGGATWGVSAKFCDANGNELPGLQYALGS